MSRPTLSTEQLGKEGSVLPTGKATEAPQTPTTPTNPRSLFRNQLHLAEGNGTIFGSVCVMVQSIIGGGLLAYPKGAPYVYLCSALYLIDSLRRSIRNRWSVGNGGDSTLLDGFHRVWFANAGHLRRDRPR